MSPYGIMPRIVVPVLVGGLFYLIAHYVFSDPEATYYGISIAAVSGGILMLQYVFQRFPGTLTRVSIPFLAGAVFYLTAHYGFSYSNAAHFGVLIAVCSGGYTILLYLFEWLG